MSGVRHSRLVARSSASTVVAPRRRKGCNNALYSQEQFRRALARERSLVLRCGHHFCLLEFELKNGTVLSREAQVLGRHVARRIRETDLAGWLSDTCLAIILPVTLVANAWSLAASVIEVVDPHHVELRCRVSPYGTSGKDSSTSVLPAKPGGAAPQVDKVLFARVPWWKRALDVLIASVALILLAPVLAVIALGIEIVSPGPVLFRQQRIGHLGRPFTCWKFRSMRVGADQGEHRSHVCGLLHSQAPLTKLENTGRDDRLIPLGRCFRASGLDELPQLVSVLCGQMSLVGPRPCMPYEFLEFLPWQRDRCITPPGLTGLWQVSGKNRTTFEEMMRLDVRYARQRSLGRDLCLIVRTPAVVLSQLAGCLASHVRADVWSDPLKTKKRQGVTT